MDVSNSVVTAIRCTVGDHIIIKFLWINKNYEANHFLKMFPSRGYSFNKIKIFNEESDSSDITDSCSGCGRPHKAHPTAKINKVKYFVLIFWSVSSPHQDFIFCRKHLEQAFFYVFFHSHPFNEMFIINGKSHCCNDTFTDVRFTLLLAKNILK